MAEYLWWLIAILGTAVIAVVVVPVMVITAGLAYIGWDVHRIGRRRD